MKRTTELVDRWELTERAEHGPLSSEAVRALAATAPGPNWMVCSMPAQVHDVLLAHGRIQDPMQVGAAEKCLWVSERDWVYRRQFPLESLADRTFLRFEGLDTIADVYLNGQLIGTHQDIYLPLEIDVSRLVTVGQNVLLVHFHSPQYWLKNVDMPEAWRVCIKPNRMLRKPHEDFNNFNGVQPYLTPVGIYAPVRLIQFGGPRITGCDLRTFLTDEYAAADLSITLTGDGKISDGDRVRIAIADGPGARVVEKTVELVASSGEWSRGVSIRVDNPQLWWPRGYGTQQLYTLKADLVRHDQILDSTTRSIGFRDVRYHGHFDYSINGKRVKLWGANFTPLPTISHVWNSEKLKQTFDLVENANMVSLRAWGPGAPYSDELYEEANRRGLLVWHEFFHTWGMYPEHDAYRDLCRREAEHQVKSLKHHPSVLFWCGGNECHMGAGMDHPDKPMVGRVIFEQDYPEVCGRLDPDRFYLVNSPYGGAFANDPAEGDSHSYNHIWYVPGEEFPIVFSENTRISPPLIKSLKRVLGDDVWPKAGFDGRIRSHADRPIPPSWQQLTLGQDFTAPRQAAVEDFYETTDTPEGLIYRMGAAHGMYIRRNVERYRRGKRASEQLEPRRSMGHYLWKLNDTYPMVYSGVIDSFIEPTMSYYALRRAYEPVLLSFDIGDHIHLWLVNDTAADVAGTVVVRLFNTSKNEVVDQFERPAYVEAGDSRVAATLDQFGMFSRQHALYAELRPADGRLQTRSIDFAEKERRIRFPDPLLSLECDRDAIIVSTDCFARSVELTGVSPDGDEFGWYFADNFFDLLPFERRRIELIGRHRKGTVTAKSFLGSRATSTQIG